NDSFVDLEGWGDDTATKYCRVVDLDSMTSLDGGVNFSTNNDDSGVDFSRNLGALSNNEGIRGENLTLKDPSNSKGPLKCDFSFKFAPRVKGTCQGGQAGG